MCMVLGTVLTRKLEMCTAPQGFPVSAALPETDNLHADRAIAGYLCIYT